MTSAGPLAVRWGSATIDPPRAGAVAPATVELQNTGTAVWRSRGELGIQLSYHWLDELGNAIHWDGLRTSLPEPVEPGQAARVTFAVRAPMPPGRYRLAVDLVDEGRCWFAELGSEPIELGVLVRKRIATRGLAVVGADPGALDAQEEPVVAEEQASALAFLAPGCVPAPDWSRRILDAHEEGYAAVGGAVRLERGLLRRDDGRLAPWAPGAGRVPGFPHPLLFPSVVRGVALEPFEVEGLPAADPPPGEPWVHDGRIVVRARRRSGRRRG